MEITILFEEFTNANQEKRLAFYLKKLTMEEAYDRKQESSK